MKRSIIDRYNGPTTTGIDVSAYQPDIHWAKVARSNVLVHGVDEGPVRFVIVRSSDGVQTRRDSAADPWAVRHLTGASGAGLPVALYHYLRGRHDPAEQVAVILDVLATSGVRSGFIALDLEGRPDDPTTPDTDESHGAWWHPTDETPPTTLRVLHCLVKMKRMLEAEGHRVVIYTGQSWHWHIGNATGKAQLAVDELGECPLWTPYYTSGAHPHLPVDRAGKGAPWDEWTIWQHAGSEGRPGSVIGVMGSCDVNRFRGDEAALARFWAPQREATVPEAELSLRERVVLSIQAFAAEADAERDDELECWLLALAHSIQG